MGTVVAACFIANFQIYKKHDKQKTIKIRQMSCLPKRVSVGHTFNPINPPKNCCQPSVSQILYLLVSSQAGTCLLDPTLS